MQRTMVAACGFVASLYFAGCGGKTTEGGGPGPSWDQCATRTACWQALLKYNPTYDAGVVDGGPLPSDCPPADKLPSTAMKELGFTHAYKVTGTPVYHADTDTCCYIAMTLDE